MEARNALLHFVSFFGDALLTPRPITPNLLFVGCSALFAGVARGACACALLVGAPGSGARFAGLSFLFFARCWSRADARGTCACALLVGAPGGGGGLLGLVFCFCSALFAASPRRLSPALCLWGAGPRGWVVGVRGLLFRRRWSQRGAAALHKNGCC